MPTLALRLLSFLVLLASTSAAFGQGTYTWNSATANWATAGNWSPSIAVSNVASNLIFEGTNDYIATNNIGGVNAAFSVNQITFNNSFDGLGVTIARANNRTISFGGASSGIVQNGVGAISFTSPLSIANNINFTIGGTGTGNISIASLTIGNGATSLNFAGDFNVDIADVIKGNNNKSFDNNLTSGKTLTLGTLGLNSGNATNSAIFSGSGRTVINGAITQGAFAGAVIKDGSGTLELNAASAYTGATTIRNGILSIGANNTLPIGTTLTIGNGANSGTLDLFGFNQTLGGLVTTGTGTSNKIINSTATAVGLVVNSSSVTPLVFAGDLGAAGQNHFSLTKNGTAILALTSDNNIFTGGTTINGGTLRIGNGGTTGVLPGSVVNFGTLEFNRSNDYVFSGDVTGTGNLTQAGAGVLTLTGTGNSFNGTTSVSTGTLRIGDGGANGSLPSSNVNIATAAALAVNTASNITLGGNLNATGTGTFASNGSGIITLTGTNTLPNVAVNAGILRVRPGTLGTSAASVTDGATLSACGATLSSVLLNSLVLGSTTGGSLRFELDGSPSLPLFNVGNTDGFVVNGTGTINIQNGATTLTTGTFPLLSYNGTVGGAGTAGLALGNLPSRVQAGLDTATAGLVQLHITAIDTITWTGSPNGNWNIGTAQPDGYSPLTGTANWKQTLGGQTTVYLQSSIPGDSVTFDGTATGTKIVNLTTELSPASVTVNTSGGDYTFTGTGSLAGATSLTKQGSGTLFLTNTGGNTFTGGTTVTGGTVKLGNGSDSSSLPGNVSLDTGTFLDVEPGAAGVTLAGNIAGSGSLRVFGPNTTTLLGSANAYSGGTTINTGATLQVGNGTTSGALPGNVLNDGSLNINPTGAGITLAGDITGSGSVLVQNNTTVTGSGNTYAGGTTINSGATLQIGDGTLTGSIPAGITNNGTLAFRPGAGGITFNGALLGSGSVKAFTNAVLSIASDSNLGTPPVSFTANAITLQGGTLKATATFNLDANRGITLASGGGTIDVDPTHTFTVPGTIAGTATSFTKAGDGVLVLGDAATYVGPTSVLDGTFRYGVDGVLPNATNVTVASGAILDLNNKLGTVSLLLGDGEVALGSGTLTVNGASTFNGIISGTGGLTKQGGNLLILGNQNTYTGTTTITANNTQIRIAVENALAPGSILSLGTAGGNTNRIFDLNGFNQTVAQLSATVNATGSAYVQNNDPAATILTVPVVFTVTNGGTFGSNVDAQALIRDNSGGGLLGRVALSVTGGNLVFVGPNSYTGGTTIASGATITLGTNAKLGTGTISLAGTLGATNGNTPTIDNAIEITGDATIGGGNATSVFTLNGVISGTGNLTKSNASAVVLTAANSYEGLTRINNGIIRIGIDSALPTGTSLYLGNTTTSNGIFDLNGFNQQVALLERTAGNTGTASRIQNLSGTASTLTVNYNGVTPSTYTGLLGNTGGDNFALVKSGAGTWALTQPGTYANGTTISNGALVAANTTGSATGTGAVTVQANGTLAGNGFVTGQTILDGGTLFGGIGGSLTSANTLNTGSVLLNEGAILHTTVGDALLGNSLADPQASIINLGSGTLEKGDGGPYTIRLTSDTQLDLGQSYTVTIATYTALGGGLSSADFTLDTTNFAIEPGFSIDAGETALTLTFTAAPEPTTVGLFGGIALGLIRWIRRRRAASNV